jgi:hypothetical protein
MAYNAFDHDYMLLNLQEVESEYEYKEEWLRFLHMVQYVRNKRKERFNKICMKLQDNVAICYQIKNSEEFMYKEIEGLWVIIRGDIWRDINPNIYIQNEHVENTNAVFLQFQGIHTDDYNCCGKLNKNVFHDEDIICKLYQFIQKRYLSTDDIKEWVQLIQSGIFGKHFTTISIIQRIYSMWVPKHRIYYFDPDKIGLVDGILEFHEGNLSSVPIKPKKSTNALQRTLFLTNEDCEKYCLYVEETDSKPYAFNALYFAKHRVKTYYRSLVYNLEFIRKEYYMYIQNEIENICVK